LLRLILDYTRSSEVNVVYAVGLSVTLFICENGRVWTLMLTLHLGFVLGMTLARHVGTVTPGFHYPS